MRNDPRKDGKRPFLRRLGALKKERDQWESHWKELQEYILPRRGRFLADEVNRGEKLNSSIINNTATGASRALAAGLMAGITSPARPWFRLTIPDPDKAEFGAVKTWLGKVEERMRMVFARSNMYNALHSVYEELGVFGTGAILVFEDFHDVVRAYPQTVGSYYLGVDHRQVVDTLYREVNLTARQMVQEFGIDAVSQTVRNLYDRGDGDQWIEICHCIEPNEKRNIDKKDAGNKPYLSVYFEKGGDEDKLLRVSGFDEPPLLAPRWNLVGMDVYGRSPGMDALGDIKQLQHEERRKAQGIDKLVNPPMIAPASMKRQPISLLPGGVTFVDQGPGGQGMTPAYQVNIRLGELMADIQEVTNRVKRTFYEDLFLMLANSDRRQITAREIDERHEEKLLMLGPVLERLHNELLDPLIDRVFAVMERAGLFPPPPQELDGETLRVEYVSVLAQAQKLIGTSSIERLAGFVGNMAGLKPEVLDKFDADQAVDEYADMMGVPATLVRPDDEVAKVRAERARQQAAVQQATALREAAGGAKDLADAKIGEGNESLLSGLLGTP